MAEKKEPEGPRMALMYVQFRDPVPVGVGEHASIDYWSSDKHGRDIACAERGNWIVLTSAKRPDMRIRVPMTNVAMVREHEHAAA